MIAQIARNKKMKAAIEEQMKAELAKSLAENAPKEEKPKPKPQPKPTDPSKPATATPVEEKKEVKKPPTKEELAEIARKEAE